MLPYRLCVLSVNSRVLYSAVFTFLCLICWGFVQEMLCKSSVWYYFVVTVVQLHTNQWATQVEELNICHVLSGCRDSDWQMHITNKTLSFYSRSLLLLLLLLSSMLSPSSFLLLSLIHHCSRGHWKTLKAYFHYGTNLKCQ
jgi:hypothetical protein